MANPVILFYNLENEKGRKLKLICLRYKIKIKIIQKEQYGTAVGLLAGLSDISAPAIFQDETDNDFTDEMLVFHNFDDRLLNAFLQEFKRNSIPRVNLKAVLTEQNKIWSSWQLHKELAAEHEAMSSQS